MGAAHSQNPPQSNVISSKPSSSTQKIVSGREITNMISFFQGIRDNDIEVCTKAEKDLAEATIQYLKWLCHPRDDKQLRSIYESFRQAHMKLYRPLRVSQYDVTLARDIGALKKRFFGREDAHSEKERKDHKEILNVMGQFLKLGQLPSTAYVSTSPIVEESLARDPQVLPFMKQNSGPSQAPPAYDAQFEESRNLRNAQIRSQVEEALSNWAGHIAPYTQCSAAEMKERMKLHISDLRGAIDRKILENQRDTLKIEDLTKVLTQMAILETTENLI